MQSFERLNLNYTNTILFILLIRNVFGLFLFYEIYDLLDLQAYAKNIDKSNDAGTLFGRGRGNCGGLLPK